MKRSGVLCRTSGSRAPRALGGRGDGAAAAGSVAALVTLLALACIVSGDPLRHGRAFGAGAGGVQTDIQHISWRAGSHAGH